MCIRYRSPITYQCSDSKSSKLSLKLKCQKVVGSRGSADWIPKPDQEPYTGPFGYVGCPADNTAQNVWLSCMAHLEPGLVESLAPEMRSSQIFLRPFGGLYLGSADVQAVNKPAGQGNDNMASCYIFVDLSILDRLRSSMIVKVKCLGLRFAQRAGLESLNL